MGEVKGLLLRFSVDDLSDTKQGKTGTYDFEFNSINLQRVLVPAREGIKTYTTIAIFVILKACIACSNLRIYLCTGGLSKYKKQFGEYLPEF